MKWLAAAILALVLISNIFLWNVFNDHMLKDHGEYPSPITWGYIQ